MRRAKRDAFGWCYTFVSPSGSFVKQTRPEYIRMDCSPMPQACQCHVPRGQERWTHTSPIFSLIVLRSFSEQLNTKFPTSTWRGSTYSTAMNAEVDHQRPVISALANRCWCSGHGLTLDSSGEASWLAWLVWSTADMVSRV